MTLKSENDGNNFLLQGPKTGMYAKTKVFSSVTFFLNCLPYCTLLTLLLAYVCKGNKGKITVLYFAI